MQDIREIVTSQIDLDLLTREYFRKKKEVISGQGVDPYVIQDGREVLQLTSLDYLSLACDPRVLAVAAEALETYGVGSLASPIVSGTLDIHLELRKKLSEYMVAPDSIVFTSGMLTNIGTIPAIIDSQFRYVVNRPEKATRAIFTDSLSHESIRMACSLAKAQGVNVFTYRHNDIKHLEHLLDGHIASLNMIVTDAVFSMEGDIAYLKEITQLAESYRSANHKIVVYADDAHGVGVLGANGRGACEECGVEDKVVRMGVVSKAFGTLGGYIVGDEWFIDYLCYCTTQMFSMGVPAAETAATIKAIEIAQNEPWRRRTVLGHADYLRKNLASNGFEVLGDAHIVSVIIGDEAESSRVAAGLKTRGILCPEIKYPAVAKGRARLRLSPVYKHTRGDLDIFLNALIDLTRSKRTLLKVG